MFQPAGLYVVIACGLDRRCQITDWQVIDSIRGQQISCFQIFYGFFDISPGCVLGKNGADSHLKGRIAGPPVARTEGLKQPVVKIQQDGLPVKH